LVNLKSVQINAKHRQLLRDQAKQYLEVCLADRNQTAKVLWRDHNSLRKTRPPVAIHSFWHTGSSIDLFLEPNQTEAFGWVENWFKRQIWQGTNVKDDTVFLPWFTVRSQFQQPSRGIWGIDLDIAKDKVSGGRRYMPVVKELEQLQKLEATPHKVLEKNGEITCQLRDIFGDILPVHEDRSTFYPYWGGTDLSEAAGALFGLTELMYLLYDKPEMVHALMAFMRDAVIANLKQGEAAGDWSLDEHRNYFMPSFVDDLPDPAPNSYGAKLKDLWFFTHAQEFEGVNAKLHEEFLLNYQLPIMELFGLVAYGCCETLDKKIELLRKIPNLRRICIGPTANVKLSADQIGRDYILSWRPNPSMVGPGYDLDTCREIIRRGFQASKGCNIELMLKEMMTIEHDPQRLVDFARMAIEEAETSS
jgi:hypothetical protein